MASIYKDNVEYPCGGNNSTAYFAQRALSDDMGNKIRDTYMGIKSGAGYHNSIFVDEDITSLYESGELYTRISNGTFDGLFVGMHFTAQYDGKPVVFRIAGFDIYLNNGDTALTRHHAVIVPDSALCNAQMNASNTTEGAYYGSKMRNETILGSGGVDEKLTATFGSHLLSFRELLSKTMNPDSVSGGYPGYKGASSDWAWYDSKSDLMSEVEVYGSAICGSSFFDVGSAKAQLPLFALAPHLINPGRFLWWLRAVVSSTNFANVNNNGNANNNNASNSNGVRPRFTVIYRKIRLKYTMSKGGSYPSLIY